MRAFHDSSSGFVYVDFVWLEMIITRDVLAQLILRSRYVFYGIGKVTYGRCVHHAVPQCFIFTQVYNGFAWGVLLTFGVPAAAFYVRKCNPEEEGVRLRVRGG